MGHSPLLDSYLPTQTACFFFHCIAQRYAIAILIFCSIVDISLYLFVPWLALVPEMFIDCRLQGGKDIDRQAGTRTKKTQQKHDALAGGQNSISIWSSDIECCCLD